MSDCRRFHELIEQHLGEGLSASDHSDLAKHCRDCHDCAELMTLHTDLVGMRTECPIPEKSAFRDMRTSVLDETATSHAFRKTSKKAPTFLADLGRFWRAHLLPSGFATAAVLVCALFVGRMSMPVQSLESELLRHAATGGGETQAGIADFWESPYFFDNVSVRRRGQGQLAFSFDASRHLEMELPQTAPLAREILLHAILAPSSLGSRLEAMKMAPEIQDERLKEALIATLLYDADPTVRINALGVLVRYPYDQRSEDTLIQALSLDHDVQIRMTVLEELSRHEVDPSLVRTAINKNSALGTKAILRQAAQYF